MEVALLNLSCVSVGIEKASLSQDSDLWERGGDGAVSCDNVGDLAVGSGIQEGAGRKPCPLPWAADGSHVDGG